ncbi:hypothetical protein CMK11_01740 [Candidatus Poribacteria bacterium]|nr:hypothetical protein [Candidatus Poribacteria bacterium]
MIRVGQILAFLRVNSSANRPSLQSPAAIPVNHGRLLSPLAPESTFIADPAYAACDRLLGLWERDGAGPLRDRR